MKIKYEKPSIKKVKLVPSEAVLAACKNASTVGPFIPNACTVQLGCSVIGS